MPLQAPNLDDRRFADILAEAKTLIPRYAPEWTDHNDSDPGITLLQLFAWMTDMLLYRLNQVPDLNYIKFLQLLGIELTPAHPAQAELTFTLSRPDLDTVIIPKETQVALPDGGDGQPMIFETEEALIALGAALKAVQVYDGFAYTIETTKNNAAGQWFYPFGPNAREGSALMLGFDSPLDFTDQQVNLAVYVHTEGLSPMGSHCDIDLNALPVVSTLAWEFWDGKQWQPLSLDRDDTRAFTRSGHIYWDGPGAQVRKAALGSVTGKLYWFRCRLASSGYETPPRLEAVLTNTTLATQAVTVRDEVLGGSDGTPGQSFTLANIPVVARDKPETVVGADGLAVQIRSLRLEVDEGHGFLVWQEVGDFYDSQPDSPHYTLDRTTGVVTFGDGRKGRIPVANPANPGGNIVARLYRYGGGKGGNAGANTITGLQTFIADVDGVTNLRPAYGGSNEETVDDAKLRAPQELKSKGRAVTAEDFEYLAVQTPGVRIRRAKALPLVHPQFRDALIPGVVTVIVVPDSDAPNPTPAEATLAIVCAHLNVHRLLTSELYVVGPTYRKVKIEADIIVRPDADLAEVKRAAEARLTAYFHPLTGGDAGTGWDFGGAVFFSKVYRVVLETPGVDRIQESQLFIWLDDERQAFCLDVSIHPGELLYTVGHDITVAYGP
jgi:predicted phage baseplate assembly protein